MCKGMHFAVLRLHEEPNEGEVPCVSVQSQSTIELYIVTCTDRNLLWTEAADPVASRVTASLCCSSSRILNAQQSLHSDKRCQPYWVSNYSSRLHTPNSLLTIKIRELAAHM